MCQHNILHNNHILIKIFLSYQTFHNASILPMNSWKEFIKRINYTCIFLLYMVTYRGYINSDDWVVLIRQSVQREGGIGESRLRSNPGLPPGAAAWNHSRVGRVIPLTITYATAWKLRLMANCGWYRGRNAFRPDGWDEWHIFLYLYLFTGEGDKRKWKNS